MANLKKEFNEAQRILANYDFNNLLEGEGNLVLYGLVDTAGSYTLISKQIASSTYDTLVTASTNPNTDEINFDYEFNTNQRVNGKLYVTLTYGAQSGGGSNATAHILVRPLHYDGTTETELASQQQTSDLVNSSGSETQQVETLAFDIDKTFSKGQKLRIEVIVYVQCANINGYARLYHDGANRDLTLTDVLTNTSADSNLLFNVPIKLRI